MVLVPQAALLAYFGAKVTPKPGFRFLNTTIAGLKVWESVPTAKLQECAGNRVTVAAHVMCRYSAVMQGNYIFCSDV